MADRLSRTLRGSLAGAVAAGVWAAQQPLDMRVFGVRYDDSALLGRWVTGSRASVPLGHVLHVLNGAAFGAAYANVASRVPAPVALRGPLFGLAEHLATWPSMALLPRLHPRASEFPRLWGSARAFAQASWRHLLFGTVLGVVEQRLNGPGDPGPVDAAAAASNGHGSARHLVLASPEAS